VKSEDGDRSTEESVIDLPFGLAQDTGRRFFSTNELYEFIKIQPLFTSLLTLRQLLLPFSERFHFPLDVATANSSYRYDEVCRTPRLSSSTCSF